jgi:predicted O-methyltransferase YrrM
MIDLMLLHSLPRLLQSWFLASPAPSLALPVADGVNRLGSLTTTELNAIFAAPAAHAAWGEDRCQLEGPAFPDGSWGVNPGDRRALYYLIHVLRPGAVLEIGTHIGCSTLSMAMALRRVDAGPGPRLWTVDLFDVNDPVSRPWQTFGAQCSPRELCDRTGCGDLVAFHPADSLQFLRSCSRSFDLIFLDGLHDADRLYQEIPLALDRLNSGGVLVLHDYFPNHKPLWAGEPVIPGPFQAVRRLQHEGLPVRVQPVGTLPWPTKRGSCRTSLAMLVPPGDH